MSSKAYVASLFVSTPRADTHHHTPEHERRVAEHTLRIQAEIARLKLRGRCECGGRFWSYCEEKERCGACHETRVRR